ncbi:MAG: hypothetical protein K2X01_03025 [Cyanobacteria bacterium]|nr:hypothetical protein [Cyanobacteriota bacterium]
MKRALVLFFAASCAAYAVFFRFDYWVVPSAEGTVNLKPTLMQRDNLFGETQQLAFVSQTQQLARWVGQWPPTSQSLKVKGSYHINPLLVHAGAAVEQTQTAVVQSWKTIQQKFATLQPGSRKKQPHLASKVTTAQQAMWVDLNGDELGESIQKSIPNSIKGSGVGDGLYDISVKADNQEIFYGRGKRLVILPTRHAGWADLELEVTPHEHWRFTYQPELLGYSVMTEEAAPVEVSQKLKLPAKQPAV